MASPFQPGGGRGRSGSPFAPSSSGAGGGGPNPVTRFIGNFVGDVKDAVVGLPMGLKLLVQNPQRAGKQMASATWHTWSPLFHGDVAKFGKQFYDHPLAPLLDVATVFSLGAGAAARGASGLSKAGLAGPRTKAVAGLRQGREITLPGRPDKAGRPRPDMFRQLSARPTRRLIQEASLQLPRWVTRPAENLRYERAFTADMAHRVAAKGIIRESALGQHTQWMALTQGAKALNDPEMAPRVRTEIVTGMYTNLLRHNEAYAPDVAANLVKKNKGYGYIVAAEQVDKTARKMIRKAQRKEVRWDKLRVDNAEMAHALPKIEKELADASSQLTRMQSEGWRVAQPAKTKLKDPTPLQAQKVEFAPLVEQQNLVNRLEKMHAKAHVAKGEHSKAVGELEALKRARMDWEQRSFVDYFRPAGESTEAFESFVGKFGSRVTTRKLDMAARTNDGRVYVVPVGDARKLGIEARDSARFMNLVWHRPTQLWKMALLGYTPRIVTNNAVGNWAIYAAREGGDLASIKGLHDAMRLSHGKSRADEALLSATPFRKNHWLFRYFGDELGNVFKRELDDLGPGRRSLKEGFYPLVHKLADEPVRIASIGAYLRRSSEVQELMKKGLSFDKAAHRALRRSPELRRRAGQHARATAGDYITLSPLERRIRAIMPFYLWNRHILKSTGNMVLDTPGRVAVMQKISVEGIEETEKWLGELPEFLRGAVPFGKKDGRASVLLTHSLNPFATVGELASMGEALTAGGGVRPGVSLLGQTHPFLSTGGEFVFKQNLLTGAPKEFQGGFLTGLPVDIVEKLPQSVLVKQLRSPDATVGPSGADLLYGQDETRAISSLFGVPIRNVSLERARELAEKESGKKKPRGKSASPFSP